MTTSTEHAGRPTCYRCMKPGVACVCALVPRVQNRTEVIVFQHPRERFHPLGTARLVELGLERAHVETLWPNQTNHLPRASLSGKTALLYPSADARDLRDLSPSERPERLVAIDGTWSHARCLHRDAPWLGALPHVMLRPDAPSRYRIRREPHRDYLSTVEAIVRALQILESDTPGLAALIDAFDRMIDRQIELAALRRSARHVRVDDGRPKGLPRTVHEEWERVVIVYGESTITGTASTDAEPDARSIVQWTAMRPSTGATLDVVLRTDRTLVRPWHLRYMELSEEDLNGGATPRELARAWRDFASPGDTLVAWNQGVMDLLQGLSTHDGPTLALKSIYRASRAGISGSLEDLVRHEGIEPEALPLRGRAARRVGNAAALLRHLAARA
jgi:DTW domain-containing protein